MIKKIKKVSLGALSFITMPVGLALVACSPDPNVNLNKSAKENNFLDIKIWNSKTKKRFTAKNITHNQLSGVGDLNAQFNSSILIGGFGEPRKFYLGSSLAKTSSRWINYHAGNDIIVPQDTPLHAPAHGEVFAAWWFAPNKESIGNGIGGGLGFRMKIDSLNINHVLKEFVYVKKMKKTSEMQAGKKVEIDVIDKILKIPKLAFAKNGDYVQPSASMLTKFKYQLSTKKEWTQFLVDKEFSQKEIQTIEEKSSYIYTYFIHLGKKTTKFLDKDAWEQSVNYRDEKYNTSVAKNISPENPLSVKKGDIIGFVGGTPENGGWTPHIHVETFFYNPFLNNKPRRSYRDYKIPNKASDIENKFWRKYLYRNASATGTHQVVKGKERWSQLHLSYEQYYLLKDGMLNSNDVYHFYDQTTPIVKALSIN